MFRLLFALLLIPFFCLAATAQGQRCFKAFIGNREVTEFCVNTPVRFEDCSGTPNITAEFYDLDDANGQFDAPQLNTGAPFIFSTPGTYVVGQLLTTNPPSTGKNVYPQTYIVRATPPPAFTTLACGPNQVQVTIQSNPYDSLYLFLNGANRQVVTNGQVIPLTTSGGPVTIKVLGKYRNANCGAEQTQTVTPPSSPGSVKITKLKIRPGGVLAFYFSGLQSGYQYQLQEQNGSTFFPKTTINFNGSATDSLILAGQNTSISSCFQLVAVDNCNQQPLGVPSPVICSTLIQATALNNQNVLTWSAYSGQTPSGSGFAYTVFRRENQNGTRTEITPATFQATTYTDTQIVCGRNYCYELEITDASGGFSISDKSCVNAISTDIPPAPALVTSFGTDNVLQGTVTIGNPAELKTLTVFKNANGLNFGNFTTATTPAFKDPDKNFKFIKPCYQVTFINNCENTSLPSNTSCPVILTSEVDKVKRTATLNWTEYGGFAPGTVDYTLERLDANFNVVTSEPLTSIFTTEVTLSDSEQILRYRIKASSNGQFSYSNLETIIQEVKIFVPNAFSPNGDGLNDVFEVKGRFQNNFSLLILDRWGQVVFESRDPRKGWNGQINGKPAVVGVYAYRLRAFDETGRLYETSGTLTLVK